MKSALNNDTFEEQLKKLRGERDALAGKKAKKGLTQDEQSRVKALDQQITSAEKNAAVEKKKRMVERVAKKVAAKRSSPLPDPDISDDKDFAETEQDPDFADGIGKKPRTPPRRK
jgi:hypothetical protein